MPTPSESLHQYIKSRYKERHLNSATGFVSIVGAGPGDASLLTIKAYEKLQQADIVLYDWLVDNSVMQIIPASTQCIFVGKRCGQHTFSQDDIVRLLIKQARLGKKVVRLKGGDPAIFARTAEEILALKTASIAYEIIPGITAASGAAASLGIPLTNRDNAHALTFITGHFKEAEKSLDWLSLSEKLKKETVVVYMGLSKVTQLCKKLLEVGANRDLPIALIDNACSDHEQRIQSTLIDMDCSMQQVSLKGPAILIIGQVLNLQTVCSKKLMEQVA